MPVLAGATATELKVVETHPYLMRRELNMVSRGLLDVKANHPLSRLVENLSKTAVTLSKNINIARCTALSDVLRAMSADSDNVNMNQLYREAETKKHKMERHYTVAKQDTLKKEKHCAEKVQFYKKYSQWKPEFLKMMEKYQYI